MNSISEKEFGALQQQVRDLEDDMRQVVRDVRDIRNRLIWLIIAFGLVISPIASALATRFMNGGH